MKKILAGMIAAVVSAPSCLGMCGSDNRGLDDRAVEVRYAEHRTAPVKKHWVRIGQCQLSIDPSRTDAGTYEDHNLPDLTPSIQNCLSVAAARNFDVLVLPELALAFESSARNKLINSMKDLAGKTGMIIVAGSYYDADRKNTLLIVGPGWIETGFKIRQSRFEVSPAAGKGMTATNKLLVLRTDFGNFAVFTCVDLISDTVQSLARGLATAGEIDMIININHNPAAWEFLIEANSIVRRHPVFVSITNAVVPQSGYDARNCFTPGSKVPNDGGYCYGHTAVFAGLKDFREDIKLPEVMRLKEAPGQLAYNQMVADAGTFAERVLTYEANMWMTRAPDSTNAPDQGYPTIRNIEVLELGTK